MSSQPDGGRGAEPVFRLSGDLDFRTASSSRAALLQAVEQAPGGLVIDLTAVGVFGRWQRVVVPEELVGAVDEIDLHSRIGTSSLCEGRTGGDAR